MFDTLRALPVSEIAAGVTGTVLRGTVTIVAAATGSGKSLLLPANLATVTGKLVVVLVPRRFLAVNAAETVSLLSELQLGQEVGYAVGAQSGEPSKFSAGTRVLYCTYGYALEAKLLTTADLIVFDEVHEVSMDMSICRALVRRRLQKGEVVNILEMSATINAQRQADYWSGVATTEVVSIDGRTLPCEERYSPDGLISEEVKKLIDEGRKGILVPRPGRKEVEDTAAEIKKLCGDAVEVAVIYGELDHSARNRAVAPPAKGQVKVLVGTNVVESGANIPWLDAGVTCGTAKQISVRPETGATYLELIDLPQWRLDQQRGRVNRFCPGIFVLCSPLAYDKREAETLPEISRLPLTELVLHCASLGIMTDELTFDYAPDDARIRDAEIKLQKLGLLDVACKLTKAGGWMSQLPVGSETGALLWHAKQIGVLGTALSLAAVIEVGGIRDNFKLPHNLNSESDWLDSLVAFNLADSESTTAKRKEIMQQNNISYRRFEAVKEMLRDLKHRLRTQCQGTNTAHLAQLKLCLVAGFITNLFTVSGELTPVLGDRSHAYKVGNGSAVRLMSGIALGQLRTIQPVDQKKSPFTIVGHLTDVSRGDLQAVVHIRLELLVTKDQREKVGAYKYEIVRERKLFGVLDIGIIRLPSPLTAEEEAARLAFEAEQAVFKERIAALSVRRVKSGQRPIIYEFSLFRFDYSSRLYHFSEEDVTAAEDRLVKEMVDSLYKTIQATSAGS